MASRLKLDLRRALDMASHSITGTIKDLKPDIIIYDFHQEWATVAAASIGIPAVQFFITYASLICYTFHLKICHDVDFPFPELNLRGKYWNTTFQEILKQHEDVQIGTAERSSTRTRTFDTMFMKTFGEIEGKYIEYASKLMGKKIVPTGPLVIELEDAEDNSEIMEWLNNKEMSSTVLVSFGSESFLSKEEIEEVAKGLELSMVNFIWVLRFTIDQKISIEEALPNGFLKRVGNRGLVVEKWAPQVRILGHPNVGGFVSHCGWSSIMEAMSIGVPMVGIPMNLDTPVNARLMEEIGVGLEVGRDENGGLSGEEIAELIREVIAGGEKGKRVKDKAREMREVIRRKGEEDIDAVVEALYKLHMENEEPEILQGAF